MMGSRMWGQFLSFLLGDVKCCGCAAEMKTFEKSQADDKSVKEEPLETGTDVNKRDVTQRTL